jgi:epoxyqueuosine reductase
VCPHNRFATPNTTPELQPTEKLLKMSDDKWKRLTKEEYDTLFAGSAVERCGYEQLVRNITAMNEARHKN